MKKADRTSTRTSRAKIENFGVIALRLPAAELERTQKHADREARAKGNFARRIYLMGLAQYEAELGHSTARA
ncbi:hypothetical protein [Variovorax sp.]|uniref:hypothetical protein n=1 Tax=Variovorax sp. TaxID=1871043 RepID=UPI003BAB8A9A